jgi:hypothetical protein
MRLKRAARAVVDAPGRLLRHVRLRRLVGLARRGAVEPSDEAWLVAMRAAWGNPSAADVGLLRALVQAASGGERAVLECGSGLTTVVLGLLAERRPFPHVALEDSPRWASVTRARLRRLGLGNPSVRVAPLQDHGAFDWYDVGVLRDDEVFDVVVCDGPRAAVARGGRVGVLHAAAANLAPTVEVLLDDVHRAGEQAVLAAWQRDLSVTVLDVLEEPSGKASMHLRVGVDPS